MQFLWMHANIFREIIFTKLSWNWFHGKFIQFLNLFSRALWIHLLIITKLPTVFWIMSVLDTEKLLVIIWQKNCENSVRIRNVWNNNCKRNEKYNMLDYYTLQLDTSIKSFILVNQYCIWLILLFAKYLHNHIQ